MLFIFPLLTLTGVVAHFHEENRGPEVRHSTPAAFAVDQSDWRPMVCDELSPLKLTARRINLEHMPALVDTI
jgi:hypothetical protein